MPRADRRPGASTSILDPPRADSTAECRRGRLFPARSDAVPRPGDIAWWLLHQAARRYEAPVPTVNRQSLLSRRLAAADRQCRKPGERENCREATVTFLPRGG